MLRIGFECPNRALAGLLALSAGVLISGIAVAQDAPAAPEDEPAPSTEPEHKIQLTKKRPMIDLATPTPAGPVGRTFHEHDGFTLRINAGLGTLLSAKASGDVGPSVETGGLTLSYDLLIGGAPSPGFTLGGALSGAMQLSGDWELDSGLKVASGNLNTIVIGPFAEGYPDPHGNLHFGGMLGLARLGADTSGPGDNLSAIGVGGAFWAGTGVWVAPDWSVGGLIRLDAATGKDDDVSVTSVGLSVMFSVLYN
ncbi:MAG: hypothetical protein ABI895_32065 [Deltaproteobacteria bacterium]